MNSLIQALFKKLEKTIRIAQKIAVQKNPRKMDFRKGYTNLQGE